MDDFRLISASMSANCELINLRLDYLIELGNNSPNRNQNLLNLLDLIHHAERKVESFLHTSNQVPPSEETSVEVDEGAETTKMEDVIDSEEIVEDSIDIELVTVFSRNSSTSLEDVDDDSHELELIPQFFFAEEEGDYSLELELIFPYFFVESEDVDSLTGRSLLCEEVETPETIEFSQDLIAPLDLNCKNCLSLHLDFTRNIFDRGRWFHGSIFIDDYHWRCVFELALKHGYKFNSLLRNSSAVVSVEDGNTGDGNYMFVKMLQWGISHQMASVKSSHPCFNLTSRVLDRGKKFEAINRLYFITHPTQITSIRDISSNAKYTRLIFDRGRLLALSKRYYYYRRSFEFSFGVIISSGFELFLVRSNMFLHVEKSYNQDDCKLLDRRQQQGKVLWIVFLRQMTKEAAYGKAGELIDQLHHTGIWSGSDDISSVILHLTCWVLSNLVARSVIHGSGKVQKLSVKIADYITGNFITYTSRLSRVFVWKIPLKELRYLQTFLISISTVVKGHIYLSDIGVLHILLLTFEVYERELLKRTWAWFRIVVGEFECDFSC
ncbi:uncharacterized protein LOC113333004 isoform X2 [Papaver somniferum]|uniref:uncharacterized protein LOC113333004 isoform X2 n=1 Tax=Papaver somniferum TaxID=3469 RepID=UPI000E6F90E4|nr:uncharacterized protein LOC113333004 isoform X2 [Papaver somniferum]